MTIRYLLPAALVLMLGASAASAAQTVVATVALPCVTSPEAEALVAAVIPELIVNVGTICATALPPTALVRQTSGAFIDRYRAEADTAWPRGRAAIAKITGPDIASMLDNDMARPLLANLVTPMLTRGIQAGDCPAIERIVTLAQPLPPRNAAALFVSIIQLVDAKRSDRQKPRLPICPQGTR
ncbi:hypothetical protein [Sphingomonas sp. 28-63-12]|uniref:hypothetical protein n=1 Tax=Sphingomonas sp. 28-63-12 TaxID=1970434 RepID=UPI000BCBD357|nr:MAG: hypothetical protein B7Y47_04345 [Sphingomonas sp. 28-63-12]